MSSTMPPDQPTQPSSTPPPRAAGGMALGASDIARLPIPGNAEFLLWVFLEIIFTILWWFRDSFTTDDWTLATIVLTFGYFVSRGIAKASRVLEQ
jgi:hypothetical protein